MTRSPDAYARDLADNAAGASFDFLQATLHVTSARLDVWIDTYRAALAQPQPVTTEPPLTVPEAAERLRCGTTKVRELVRTGKLQKIEALPGKTLITAASVDHVLKGKDETT